MSEIYALSDDVLSPDEIVATHAKEILQNGVKYYQYRSKKSIKNEYVARELLNLCHEFGAKFIVNDDIYLAKKIGATCVHIGKDDAGLKEARQLLGKNAYIGVSCYDDIDLAIKLANLGANYVAFGAVYPSKTKPNTTKVSLETLKKAKEILNIPICAIGGINTTNVSELVHLGIDMVAIVRAIYKPHSITQNLENFKKAMKFTSI